MQIRILETGEPPEPLKSQFGDYFAMFQRLIGPHSPRFSFATTRAHQGEAMPALADFDGLLITGSPAGVYDEHDWIEPCSDLVRRTALWRRGRGWASAWCSMASALRQHDVSTT